MEQPIILSARNISKSYQDLEVLKGVSLDVPKGEVVAIVGPSGAGKSTLLHILGTLDFADSGTITIAGAEVSTFRGDALADFRNQNLGFIFQNHNLLPEFTAFENVCIPGLLGNRSKKEVENRAAYLLERLGLSGRHHHKPSQLSGGEQQRVSVARALINRPAIIFGDEPSGNLDAKNAEQLHRLFFELRDEMQQTFVIVTHNKSLADMADRKLEMMAGRLSTSGL